MIAFKLYSKMINFNKKTFLSYFLLFIALFFILTKSIETDFQDFAEDSFTINITDEDSSQASKALIDYLSQKNQIVNLVDDPAKIEEALYYEEIDYSLKIKKGFEEDLKKEKMPEIETFVGINRDNELLIDMEIRKYMDSLRILYENLGDDPTDEEMTWAFEEASRASQVKIQGNVRKAMTEKRTGIIIFSQMLIFSDYILVAVAFLSIGLSVVSIEEKKTRIRTGASGYPLTKMTWQIFLASIITMSLIWLIIVIISIFVSGFEIIGENCFPWALLSSYSHLLAITSLTIMLVHLFPKKEAASFFSTVLSLGLAFSSGIFIPEFIMPESVLKFSSIFPTRWDVINQRYFFTAPLNNLDRNMLLKNISSMLLMALLYLLITIIIRRKKSMS